MYTLRKATSSACKRPSSNLPKAFTLASRRIHSVRPLPFDIEDGLGEFLSPEALRVVAQEYQQGLLDRLNEEVIGTELENLSVAQTVISASTSIRNVLAFNYASQALNNSFFFDNLLPPGDSPPPLAGEISEGTPPSHEHTMSSHLLALINSSFGSLSQLKSSMSAAAFGMMGSGWIWLVCDENASHLAFVATYGPGTMLVRSRQHRHPEGLSPNFGVGPGGLSTGQMFKVLGEKGDPTGGAKVDPKRPLGTRPPSSRSPLTRNFHNTAATLSSTALRQSALAQARFSQAPLAWRTAVEPLSSANRHPSVPRGLQYSSASIEEVDDLLPAAEESELPSEEPASRPIISSTAINATMHHRSNSEWNVNRWRGDGDDLSPLMCISVHEHMWMAGGYGIWGKEEYLRRFWNVVNWGKVSRVLDLWTPNAVPRATVSSLSRPKRGY
ncbi:hypothetical protein M408DRAFT_19745 [Serendipita vermifera MAFF 305830]|uniref:Manganese/iron superoxide dismutase C-terminal domain-containing protein n=1 Tax=Serendipita vermifera MAFF 305830 TaxID=933852 RepID=A0A0C3BMX1_SERVB|nr:hypothetical protein M408DRAFT_19745 [Serendipita vermifera MAFF 305830]